MSTKQTYPEQSGTYLCSNGEIVCIVKFTGWYPNVEPEKLTVINDYIVGSEKCSMPENRIKASVKYDRESWCYKPLYTATQNDFIKNVVPDEDIQKLYLIYNDMLNNGISWVNMIGVIMGRLHCNTDEAVKWINVFDERRLKPSSY